MQWIKKLLTDTLFERLSTLEMCIEIENMKYWLEDGVLYCIGYYATSPIWIDRYAYSNTVAAYEKMAEYIMSIESDEYEFCKKPTPHQNTAWY